MRTITDAATYEVMFHKLWSITYVTYHNDRFCSQLKSHHERQGEYDEENSIRNSHRREFNSKLDQKHDLSSKKSRLIENHMFQKESLQGELAIEKDSFNLAARETDEVIEAEKKQKTELEEVNADIINLKKSSNKNIQKFIGKLKRRHDRKSDHERNIADYKQKTLETNGHLKGLKVQIFVENLPNIGPNHL